MPRTIHKAARSETATLDKRAWTNAALNALAQNGIDGVRIDILARELGVTKGSFYWHFSDRDELLNAVLQEWRRRATLSIIDRLESSHEPPEQRLRRLLRLQFESRRAEFGSDVELSIRLWGRRDAGALSVLREVDELRLRYIRGLMEELGIDKTEAAARAILAYSYMRVSRSLIPLDNMAAAEACERVLFGRS
jgi:AcrR family transcriptional regulator